MFLVTAGLCTKQLCPLHHGVRQWRKHSSNSAKAQRAQIESSIQRGNKALLIVRPVSDSKGEFNVLIAGLPCCVLGQTHAPSHQHPASRGEENRANTPKSSFITALSIDSSVHNPKGNCIKIIKTHTKTWTIEHKLRQIIFTSPQVSARSSHLPRRRSRISQLCRELSPRSPHPRATLLLLELAERLLAAEGCSPRPEQGLHQAFTASLGVRACRQTAPKGKNIIARDTAAGAWEPQPKH